MNKKPFKNCVRKQNTLAKTKQKQFTFYLAPIVH